MGQFSWYTQDKHDQIKVDRKANVFMVDPRDGTTYKETCYEGYGVFGGRDFYELLADINKDIVLWHEECRREMLEEIFAKDIKDLTEKELRIKRAAGIDLWFDFVETDQTSKMFFNLRPGDKIIYPILVRDLSTWKNFVGQHPDSDPEQGC